jgi:hypothetical protein
VEHHTEAFVGIDTSKLRNAVAIAEWDGPAAPPAGIVCKGYTRRPRRSSPWIPPYRAKASLHLHAVLGLQDGTLRGGHFLSGSVQPTLEVTITESAVHLRRKKRPDLGIALISV